MLPMGQRGGLKLLRSTAALGFYLAKQKASVDWIWEPGSGFCCYVLHVQAFMRILIAIYMILSSPGKAPGANPLVSVVSKTSVG